MYGLPYTLHALHQQYMYSWVYWIPPTDIPPSLDRSIWTAYMDRVMCVGVCCACWDCVRKSSLKKSERGTQDGVSFALRVHPSLRRGFTPRTLFSFLWGSFGLGHVNLLD